MNRFLAVAGIVYAMMILAIVASVVSYRNRATQALSGAEAQQAWDEWRQVVEKPGHDAAVRRSIPRSSEPPALILLRDHFAACLTGILVMATPLYWTIVLFVRGVLSGPAMPGEGLEPDPNGNGHGRKPA